MPWPTLMLGVAALAAAGGVMLHTLLPDAPGAVARVTTLQWKALATIAMVRDKLPHLPLDANAKRMFPKEARQLGKAPGFKL